MMDLVTALCSIGYADCSATEIYNSSSANELHTKIDLIKKAINANKSIPEVEKEALKLCFDAAEKMIKKQRRWMECMKPEYKLEQYCLFLLDFLGQSEKLRHLSSNSEKEVEIKKMLNGILFLKETTQMTGITTRQQFSDTVLIYFKTADLTHDKIQEGLEKITGRIGNLFLQCLAYQMPFRGVGVIGDGFELEPNNFYGPVLLEAVEQEKSIPSYPRIVLSKEIVSIFGEKHENLFFDEDGIYCINPLTDAIRKGMPWRKTTFDKCLSFIRNEKATASLNILSKYTRLENMFTRLGISWQGCKNE